MVDQIWTIFVPFFRSLKLSCDVLNDGGRHNDDVTCSQNRQSAKINSLPKCLAIRYVYTCCGCVSSVEVLRLLSLCMFID